MLRFHLFRPRGGVEARFGLHPIGAARATNMLAYVEGDVIIDVVEHRALLVRRLADAALDGHELVPTHYEVADMALLRRDPGERAHTDPVTFRNEHPYRPKDGRPWVYVGNSAMLRFSTRHAASLPPDHPLWQQYLEITCGEQAFDSYGQPLNPAVYVPMFGIPVNAPAC